MECKYQPKTKDELKQLCKDESVYLGDIDTSLITDMSELFAHSKRQDFSGIETQDVSKVTYMSHMFEGAASFNQDIGSWNTSKITNMRSMFEEAESFNKPIGSWDTSNVTDMSDMFNGAYSFNQDISNWDVSNVTDIRGMFHEAQSFDQNISRWSLRRTLIAMKHLKIAQAQKRTNQEKTKRN